MITVSNEGMQLLADGSIFPERGRRNYYDFVRTASFVPFITAVLALSRIMLDQLDHSFCVVSVSKESGFRVLVSPRECPNMARESVRVA